MRVQGVFPHPLVLGTAVALILPVAYVRWRGTTGALRRLHLASILLMLAASYYTYSRGPLLALAAGFVMLALLGRAQWRAKVLSAIVVVVIFGAFVPTVRHS